MKGITFGLLFLLSSINPFAQIVSNIRAEQRGQDIVVFYSLETTSPCEVSLLLSQDNGITWSSALKNVAGGIGKNISSGEKQITWKVLEEREQLVGEKFKFKVVAVEDRSIEMEMIYVTGGTFSMGGASEQPVHPVTVSSFFIGKFEVTQSQWFAVMGSNPSTFSDCGNCPVESIDWAEIQEFISKLNYNTKSNYRLPTEAEWEYAAKGGQSSRGYYYSGSDDLDEVAWYDSNSGRKTHEVGGRKPNELGIYDMSGNVCELCSNWYYLYNNSSLINPKGPSTGEFHVRRGGWFDIHSTWCSNMKRRWYDQSVRDRTVGFRLVLPIVR